MIVTCRACRTRYLVDDAELGGETGRRVRCASCGNLWRFSSEEALIHTAVAAATAELEAATAAGVTINVPTAVPSQVAPMPALRPEPGTLAQPQAAGPRALVHPAVLAELPAAAGPSSVVVGGLMLLLVALILVLAAIFARDRILAMYPGAEPLYASLHLVQPADLGLRLTSTVTRTADSLIVVGSVVNSGSEQRSVGQLRVTLRDGAGHDLETRLVVPSVAALAPGEAAGFRTTFEHPSITAVAANVTFATN